MNGRKEGKEREGGKEGGGEGRREERREGGTEEERKEAGKEAREGGGREGNIKCFTMDQILYMQFLIESENHARMAITIFNI